MVYQWSTVSTRSRFSGSADPSHRAISHPRRRTLVQAAAPDDAFCSRGKHARLDLRRSCLRCSGPQAYRAQQHQLPGRPEVRRGGEEDRKKKLVIAAVSTEVRLLFPALEATAEGYEVYAVVDASGGTSKIAHDAAMQPMIQAGVIAVTWQQMMLEYQRDWTSVQRIRTVGQLSPIKA